MSKLDWQDGALCKDMDAEVFFGRYEKMSYDEEQRAKAICQECPVRQACLDYAVQTRQIVGIWGGTTPTRRMRLRSEWLRERGNERLTERNNEARRLADMGCTPDQIAAQLNVNLRTAQRITSPVRVAVGV